ncbi:MAG: recombination regulator RecX [Candidatus Accumulibacter sp.]|jgi:regulatory protein|nr:recombination regulator RecX [Accumulibacter sp.]
MAPPTLRERVLRLLARREHARAELARKLAAHAESAEELDAVLDDFVSRGLLSDARYAETRLRARGARFGNARLAQELRAAGVDGEVIDGMLAGSGDELARATAVWRRKYGAAGVPDEAAGRARQANFLMRRGFSGETIRRVLRGGHEDD